MQTQVRAVSSDGAPLPPAVGEGREGAFTKGNLCLAARQKAGSRQRAPSMTPPAQNNPHAHVVYWGAGAGSILRSPSNVCSLILFLWDKFLECRVKVYAYLYFIDVARLLS